MSAPSVSVFAGAAELADAAADEIVRAARDATRARGAFRWAAAGGGTPRRTYARLARPPRRERMPWERSEVWVGDDRLVPPDHEASNARMIREELLAGAGAAFHPFDTTAADLRAAVRDAESTLRARVPAGERGVPRLDLVLLGLGGDAHTASWFPGVAFAPDRLVETTAEAHAGYRRITLTPTLVNAARQVIFLVSGAVKAHAVAAVLGARTDPLSLPAQRVRPESGTVRWLLDQEAASELPPG